LHDVFAVQDEHHIDECTESGGITCGTGFEGKSQTAGQTLGEANSGGAGLRVKSEPMTENHGIGGSIPPLGTNYLANSID
jgi:hypothetical protein